MGMKIWILNVSIRGYKYQLSYKKSTFCNIGFFFFFFLLMLGTLEFPSCTAHCSLIVETFKAKFYGFGDSFYKSCIIFIASLDSFNHWVLWPFVCSIYVPKQLAIEFDIRWLLMARQMGFWVSKLWWLFFWLVLGT